MLSTQDFFKQVIEEVAAIKDVQAGILVNQVQAGTIINRESQEELKNLGYPTFATFLSFYVAYKEAIACGLSVIEYDPRSKAAQEMGALFEEVQGVAV